ncbi:hypothetical protein ACWDX6_23975 [Streptomyces sp. NPDC003027]
MSNPATLVDSDGDVWTWNAYDESYSSPGLADRTRAEIEREFGPVTASDTSDVRLLLAEALEDVARKLREGS